MKTAMQELIEYLNERIKNNQIKDSPITTQMAEMPFKNAKRMAEKLLELEKKQIIDAYNCGLNNFEVKTIRAFDYSEDYYNQTFQP